MWWTVPGIYFFYFLNQRERNGHRWNCHFLSFCRFEIEEHHKKGQTTPVDQWKRRELSKQELEIMYKEASGIREKSVSSDDWGIACKNEHRDGGGGGGYSCLYYFLFSCVSLDSYEQCAWVHVEGQILDFLNVSKYHDQIVTRFMYADAVIRLWCLYVLVPWLDYDEVYVCQYHDQIVTRFVCADTMIILWWGLCVQVPWSDFDEVYLWQYHDQIVTNVMCTGTMISLW